MKKKLGCPDLMILFTNTVSHKMVNSALQEAKKNNIPIAKNPYKQCSRFTHSTERIYRKGKCSMLEQYLVEHCSPTLAGLKTANLFSVRFIDEEELNQHMKQCEKISE